VRVAPAVTLSPEERSRLHRWRGRGGRRRVRAGIVLLAADGLTDLEIGRRLGVGRQTAARWRGRFLASRIRGLERSPGAGRDGRIPAEVVQAIVRTSVARTAPDGRPWSTRRLAHEFHVSHMTVRRVWETYGIRSVRFEADPPRPDPVLPPAPWDVIGLYLRPPVAALLETLHPRWASGAATPFDRGGESFPAPPARWTSTVAPRITPAFLPLRSAATAGAPALRSTEEFLRFLIEVGARVPGRTYVRVLATGLGTNDRTRLDRWRVRHPNFEFEFPPDARAWKETAIRDLGAASQSPSPAGRFRGRGEVTLSLARSIGAFSEAGGAFEWSAGGHEIAEGEAAYRLRYDLAVTAHPGFKNSPLLPRAVGTDAGRDANDRASARSVLRRYLGLRPRERLTIESWTATLDYANAFVLEALRLGARPLLLYQDEPTYWAATTEVPARSLASIGEHRKAALEHTDVFVSFFGPSDRERFHSLPTPTLFRLGEYQDALYRAAAKAEARVVQMAVGRVSEASARMYGVDATAWRKELLDGTLVPPEVLRRRARAVARAFERGHEVAIRHANGTRLSLRLKGRKPHVSDGSVARAPIRGNWSLVTLPAGVVTVAVDESFAEGAFRSNVRCSTGLSDSVGDFSGGQWTFEHGRLRRFSFDVGHEIFAASYARAGEGRDRPGCLSIGLNEHLEVAPLLEDQGLGTVGLHIGRNDHVGGMTRTPWWAWIFQRGSTVSVDGETILRAGNLAR